MKLAGAYINDDTYERLVALAAANNRTLAGQCRHLFDRALKGGLVVPDAPTAPAAGGKPALETKPVPGDAAAARMMAPPAQARPGNETFSVAGNGVAAVGPVATGFAATPTPPASGPPRAAVRAGGDACCGSSHGAGRFFNTTPTTTPEPNPERPCLCHTPHPLPHRAPEVANEPPTAARRPAR